jgi:cytochrome c-type biogenesis protein CcmH/NrfG
MNVRDLLWFSFGMLIAVAATLFISPWLRERARASWLATLPEWAPGSLALALAGAVGLYLWLGGPQDAPQETVTTASAASAIAAHGGGTESPDAMDKAVTALERRLAQSGGSDSDWELLARSYKFMGRPGDAAAARERRLPLNAGGAAVSSLSAAAALLAPRQLSAAGRKLIASAATARGRRDFAAAAEDYRQLVDLQEMTADTWADYADVTAALNGNSLVGTPEKYLQAALSLDPQHAKALWLLASLQHEAGQYSLAVSTWKKLTDVVAPDSSYAKLVAANLAEDQQLAATRSAVTTVASNRVAVRGEIDVSDALRAKVPPGLTLFILAKSVNSPGAPVAVLRTTTGSWPVRFELDDTLAMMPERTLSTAGEITVEARVSKCGQAAPQSGDLLGVTDPMDPASGKAVRIIIERVIG